MNEDAIKDGQNTAQENLKSEDVQTREQNDEARQANFDSARESAELNHKVDQDNQPDSEQDELSNDTSKKAKVETAQSQLDPSGNDPISKKDVAESATNAGNDTGNNTSVSNEEAANRAANPGVAEENADVSTATPTDGKSS